VARCNCRDPATCHDPEAHGLPDYRCPGCGGLSPKKGELCFDCLLGPAEEEPSSPYDTREESRLEV
jgi:hypothetical protein